MGGCKCCPARSRACNVSGGCGLGRPNSGNDQCRRFLRGGQHLRRFSWLRLVSAPRPSWRPRLKSTSSCLWIRELALQCWSSSAVAKEPQQARGESHRDTKSEVEQATWALSLCYPSCSSSQTRRCRLRRHEDRSPLACARPPPSPLLSRRIRPGRSERPGLAAGKEAVSCGGDKRRRDAAEERPRAVVVQNGPPDDRDERGERSVEDGRAELAQSGN